MSVETSGLQKGTIILSPHADDAALSIGGILCKRVLEEPVTLVTIFGRSNYRRDSSFQSDWKMVTETRRHEDLAFADSVKINLEYLEFPEASLRFGPPFDEIFSPRIDTKDNFPTDLLAVIKRIIDNTAPKSIFAPLGIGRHRDHLIVSRLSYELATLGIPPVVYYEDLPYAAYVSENEILQHVSCVRSALTPVYVPINHELSSKLTNLRSYKSQIGEFESGIVEYYASHWRSGHFYERVWASIPLAGTDLQPFLNDEYKDWHSGKNSRLDSLK